MARSPKKAYRFGEFTLIPDEGLLRKGEENIHLQRKVFDLLVLLIEDHGSLVTKDEIIELIWNDAYVDEAAVSRSVWAIRNALGEDSRSPRFIHTVPKRGYRFVGEIETLTLGESEPVQGAARDGKGRISANEGQSGSDLTGNLSEEADTAEVRSGTAAAALRTRKEKAAVEPVTPADEDSVAGVSRKYTPIAAAIVVIVVLAGAYAAYRRYSLIKKIESVAIMPFANQTGDPDIEYLSDGITETLIATLSELPEVTVKPRSTVFRYKGKETDPRELAADLKVDAILTGRITKRGNELLFFVELADTNADKVVWSGQYKRVPSELASLEPEMVRDLTDKLRIELSGDDRQRISRRYTSDPEAYQLYLHGRYEWNKFSTEGLTKSAEYFERAVQADPTYALAYSGLADAYINLGVDHVSPTSVMAKARIAALQAIALDNSLAEAHTSLGSYRMFYEWDMREAEKEYLLAISLDPRYANARHFYSHCLMFSGRPDEAIKEMRMAVELEPLSLVNNAELGWTYYLAGRHDEAAEQLRKTIEMDPSSAYGHWMLGTVQVETGDFEAAKASLTEGVRLAPDWQEAGLMLAYTYAKAGERTNAEALLGKLLDSAEKTYVNPVLIASVYAALNDNDRAIEWLEKGYREKSSWMSWIAIEPMLASLRPDPRFQDLVRRVRK